MAKDEKFQREKIGKPGGVNKNCWLVKVLNYSPYNRCQYCELEFHKCLFLHYQIISLILIVFFLALFFLVEGKISELVIICIFTLVIIYGYFLNKSTDKIIKANFAQREAKMALEKLTEKLEERVDEQTKDISEKNKYLQELLNMKTDFLRVVNHQLNTPLSIMRNAFAMVKEKVITPEKGFTFSDAGLERMSQTISDFWDVFELEGEKMKMKPEKTDLERIVNDLIEEKKKMSLAQKRNLKLEIKKPAFKVPPVWGDPKKTVHVVSNLLDNAVFYTEKGGVEISYELAGKDKLKVNIKDTGVGISQENEKKLFQKFSRGQGATSLHPDGSGLGLYIAKKIIESNDGELTAFSAGPGQGSVFSFTLPVFTGQKSDNKPAGVKKETIMIIDKTIARGANS